MGLSNGERFNGVCDVVSAMAELRFSEYNVISLNKVLRKLWSSLLASNSNGSYWFAGGSLDNNHLDEVGLITAAFTSATNDQKPLNAEYAKLAENNPWWKFRDDYLPNGQKLLGDDRDRGKLYKLFRMTESYFYYANRYSDKLSKRLQPTSRLVADIQGFCYKVFSNDPLYMYAWMMENILDRVFPHNADMLTDWMIKQNLHHDFVVDHNTDGKMVMELFKETQKTLLSLSSQRRIEIALKLMGRRYQYQHQYDQLYKMIEVHNKNKQNKKDKIDLEVIKSLCNACKQMHDENKKETKYRAYCYLTQQEL